ncbi:MAG: S1 family peptidase, partial [Bacteroidetes bacterium]|nr:S1 family peptidase [Bacteroidota bacterium]
MKLFTSLIMIFLMLAGSVYGQLTWKQYQVATNTTTEITYTVVSTAGSNNTSGYQGILPLNISSDTSRGFSPLDIVNDPNAYPWRMTVKIGGTTGILIDPYHVLTAGHAVSLTQGFGNTKIMPAYSQADSPFGYAYPEYVYILSNFVVSSATDIAIIKLDRPLGALTGYCGYGYNNNSAFYTGGTVFMNPSYPSAGLYNGEQMYNWKGKLDYVTSDFVYSFRTGIVGMSGSGLFTNISSTPVTYGVLIATGIKYNKINASKFDAINKIITTNTPAVPDAAPLVVNAYPKVIKQGMNPDSVTFYVHNYSSQNCPSGKITASIYLSTDSVISDQDQLLKTITVNNVINSKQTIAIKSTNIVLPALTAGDYWIGLKLTGDNNTLNNTTGFRDAAKITVAGSNYVRVTGRISSSQSRANLSGVVMQGFSGNVITDYDGRYTAFVPAGWSGVINPVREGYEFTPASFSISNASAPLNCDFQVLKKTYNLTINVQSPVQHLPVRGVQVTGIPGEPFTNASGSVSLNVYYGW